MNALTIGQVARHLNVNVETIRYYERIGLVARPERVESGFRRYPHMTVERIRFIRKAKDLGFSLKEISELLSLRVDPTGSCGDVRKKAERKITEIETKIDGLKKMKTALNRLVARCDASKPTGECPILESIEKE